MSGPVLLRAENLSKRYGRIEALKRAGFSVPANSITAFLGENGAGKTTAIKLILGFLEADAGRLEVGPCRIGYVPERPVFMGWLRGREILSLTARRYGLKADDLPPRIESLSEVLSFDSTLLGRRPQTYSLGNQKKFSYLQSLLIDPVLLIVDEPFSALDPFAIRRVRDGFQEWRERGMTILLSSHLISEVEKVCDEFIIIRRGTVVVQESLNRLRADYVFVRLSRDLLGRGTPSELQLKALSPWAKDERGQVVLLLEKTQAAALAARYPNCATLLPGPLDLEQIFFFFS
jgi:ABC-type multidrug transport system ATPase subunit